MELTFKELYANYYKRVYACCLRILKEPNMAEDATQDAFIKAFEKIETLNDMSKFGAWVTSIATNNAINMYNRNKRTISIKTLGIMDVLFIQSNKACVHNDVLDELETKEIIFDAIRRLKPRLAELIVLRYYWDLSEIEIAKLLDMPVGTVKSTLYRGRQQLHSYLSLIEDGCDRRDVNGQG